MKLRHLAAWFSLVALLGTGATLLRAQAPPGEAEATIRPARAKLRAQVVKLRAEVEMLQLDYNIARDDLLEDIKLRKGLKMAGGFMQMGFSIQNSINQAQADANTPYLPPASLSADPEAAKKAEDESKKAKLEEKKEAAEDAAFIAERKKELARLAEALAGKRLDLEDAERTYRENPR